MEMTTGTFRERKTRDRGIASDRAATRCIPPGLPDRPNVKRARREEGSGVPAVLVDRTPAGPEGGLGGGGEVGLTLRGEVIAASPGAVPGLTAGGADTFGETDVRLIRAGIRRGGITT